MPDDDAQARKERAKRLQKEIDDLINNSSDLEDTPKTIQPGESPRDFIHRRMHELDQAKHKPKPRG